MATLKDLYQSARRKISDIILGDPVKEWGEIYTDQGRFFRETLSMDLYQKNGQPVLWLKAVYKSSLSYNSYGFAFYPSDLNHFVERLRSRYDQFNRLYQCGGTIRRPDARDQLPIVHRWMIKAIYGIRYSQLLLDHSECQQGTSGYRFYAIVTRKPETKVLIFSERTSSKQEATVISGEGLAAALKVLADYLKSQAKEHH